MEEGKKRKTPSAARRIAGDILIAVFASFTVYLSAVMLHRIHTVVLADDYQEVFRNELVLCAVLLVFALDVRFGFLTTIRFLPAKIVGWLIRIAVIAGTMAILGVGCIVVGSGIAGYSGDVDHVLVLGMALEDGQPTRDLRLRVKTAADYADRHPQSVLILTGGNPDAQGRTEAAVMRELLAERGVPERQTVLEDRAADTRENFKNSAKLIDPAAPVGVVSSNYHIHRAMRLAKSAGFANALRMPAPSDPLRFGANVMWEIIMELNDLAHGK